MEWLVLALEVKHRDGLAGGSLDSGGFWGFWHPFILPADNLRQAFRNRAVVFNEEPELKRFENHYIVYTLRGPDDAGVSGAVPAELLFHSVQIRCTQRSVKSRKAGDRQWRTSRHRTF